MKIYLLFVHTEFYDYDTHYNEVLIGVFSSEELANKAKVKFEEDHIDERGMLDWPSVDEYDIYIDESNLDEFYE